MITSKSSNADVVRDFLMTHPKIKENRTAAKELFEIYPKRFNSIEEARTCVRAVMGKSGKTKLLALGEKADFIDKVEITRNEEKKRLPEQIKYLLIHKKKEMYSIEELSDMFDCGMNKIKAVLVELQGEGYTIKMKEDKAIFSSIIEKGDDFILNVDKMSTGWYKFGVLGDNHLCSRYQRLDVLNALYDEYEKQGIKVVFNTGNWIDGEARFNMHDLLVHGMDNQIDYFLENYPKRKGIVTQFITGDDHEGWYSQREGIDVGKHMMGMAHDKGREDLLYLGHMEHDVIIKAKNGETKIRILHPGGGSSYALSYAAQKIIESYQGGEKPDILVLGHYHKASYDFIRGVHTIQTGCTEDQTPFMRKKKLAAHLGGWVIEFSTDDVGAITRFKQEFFPFYDNQYYTKWRYLWK